jgi:hypothetical protein
MYPQTASSSSFLHWKWTLFSRRQDLNFYTLRKNWFL